MKLSNNLTLEQLLESDWADQFSRAQLSEIRTGLNRNIDVYYADPSIKSDKMKVLRHASENGINLLEYAKDFSVQQLEALLEGAKHKIDYKMYATLEELYKRNKEFFDELNVYIGAGEMKIEELQQKLIPEAMQKAQETGDQMDVQVVNDLHQFLDRLEKRNHDLKLTRQMTIQQAPQIRLIQNTNQTLAEKIQSSITTTIPLWKNQIAIAMTLLRQKDAVTAQRQVSETTNQLIQKNSEMLKISTIETARENERGIIDLETLQKTQQNLIETLEETLQIQQEGRMRRKAAEIELNRLEGTMQQQLLQLSDKEKALRNG